MFEYVCGLVLGDENYGNENYYVHNFDTIESDSALQQARNTNFLFIELISR